MAYYYVNEFTQELTGPVELPVYPGMGKVVPGNAIELPEVLSIAKPGYVWAWRDGQALQLVDLRNRTVYRKDNGNSQYWTQLGSLSDELTAKARPDAYHFWKNDGWALDAEAERTGLVAKAEIDRDNRLREVVIRIASLQYAYELGEASSDQLTTLQAWKRYALALARIEQQPNYPSLIDWPTAPAPLVASPTV
ncbi:tail fiber assembly protein [Pseudomonas baetica]|uniref:tail fiber assembly protein n=1 Tax=Pseudomonas baetica TaxID=674054 RepID=UPI001C8CE521|nr:tail fiber assembly protein [Pseudomonas baetica]MBX9408272.1 tail fiber assembly protein [Pseudomonas baetica]